MWLMLSEDSPKVFNSSISTPWIVLTYIHCSFFFCCLKPSADRFFILLCAVWSSYKKYCLVIFFIDVSVLLRVEVFHCLVLYLAVTSGVRSSGMHNILHGWFTSHSLSFFRFKEVDDRIFAVCVYSQNNRTFHHFKGRTDFSNDK